MGGGPSDEEKRAQRELEERNRRQEALQTQFITLAAEKDPLLTRLRDRDMRWLDFTEGKNGPVDVSKAPDMGLALNLFDRARAGQQGERMGIGALRMGAQGTNADLANLITEQRTAHREQQAAGDLERAVATREAEVTGSVLPLAGIQQQQRMGLAGLASSAAQDTLGQYTSFTGRPRRRSFFQDMLLAGWSQGAQGAAAGMGG